MNQDLQEYYVVRSVEEKDELFTTIDAMSLKEANAIFRVRYAKVLEQGGDVSFHFFSAKHELRFDENNRLIFPNGKVNSIISL